MWRFGMVSLLVHRRSHLESIIALILILAVAGWLYNSGHKAGKREGSRKGYGVGFDRGSRSKKKQSGCMIVIVLGGLFASATTVALTYLHRASNEERIKAVGCKGTSRPESVLHECSGCYVG